MKAPGHSLRRFLYRILGLGLVIGLISTIVIIGLAPIPEDAAYIGSDACSAYHWHEYKGWHGSRYPKMMSRVDRKDVVVADFDAEDAPFDSPYLYNAVMAATPSG